ncbi:hypothetical protein B0H12DRAFT_1243015 [Mycena haematopus]|nr:hypothetical protein B0H12DRAFT_1243015 [Mycena haematopus]
MLGLLAANTVLIAVLIILLAMTNWGRILVLLRWLYSTSSRWLTTSTVLVIYGVVLLYLLIVTHLPAAAAENFSRKRCKTILVPYRDHDGQLKGWVREVREETAGTEAPVNSPPRPTLPPESLGRCPKIATLVTVSRNDESLADFPHSTWNGFLDGRFRCHFTPQQVEDTSRLALYWVSDKLPGRRGSVDAVTAEKGKLTRFKCAGIIDCRVVACTAQIAPGTNVTQQLEAHCAYGAVFENSGTHIHSKYTHSLPTPKNKKTPQLQVFISKQPVVLQGSKTNINDIPESSEEDKNDNARLQTPIDSDAEDLLNSSDQDTDKSDNLLNSDDEKALDPGAEEEEEEH